MSENFLILLTCTRAIVNGNIFQEEQLDMESTIENLVMSDEVQPDQFDIFFPAGICCRVGKLSGDGKLPSRRIQSTIGALEHEFESVISMVCSLTVPEVPHCGAV